MEVRRKNIVFKDTANGGEENDHQMRDKVKKILQKIKIPTNMH